MSSQLRRALGIKNTPNSETLYQNNHADVASSVFSCNTELASDFFELQNKNLIPRLDEDLTHTLISWFPIINTPANQHLSKRRTVRLLRNSEFYTAARDLVVVGAHRFSNIHPEQRRLYAEHMFSYVMGRNEGLGDGNGDYEEDLDFLVDQANVRSSLIEAFQMGVSSAHEEVVDPLSSQSRENRLSTLRDIANLEPTKPEEPLGINDVVLAAFTEQDDEDSSYLDREIQSLSKSEYYDDILAREIFDKYTSIDRSKDDDVKDRELAIQFEFIGKLVGDKMTDEELVERFISCRSYWPSQCQRELADAKRTLIGNIEKVVANHKKKMIYHCLIENPRKNVEEYNGVLRNTQTMKDWQVIQGLEQLAGDRISRKEIVDAIRMKDEIEGRQAKPENTESTVEETRTASMKIIDRQGIVKDFDNDSIADLCFGINKNDFANGDLKSDIDHIIDYISGENFIKDQSEGNAGIKKIVKITWPKRLENETNQQITVYELSPSLLNGRLSLKTRLARAKMRVLFARPENGQVAIIQFVSRDKLEEFLEKNK